jgi:hypothetical protein
MMAKQDTFDRTLRTIRVMVDSAIKDAARLGKRSVTINIPGAVFGHEPYNLAEMGKAMAHQLTADDYTVSGSYAQMTVMWSEAPRSAAKREQMQSGSSSIINVPKPKPPPK